MKTTQIALGIFFAKKSAGTISVCDESTMAISTPSSL
jgi:hypothetical protein